MANVVRIGIRWFLGLRQPWLWSLVLALALVAFAISSRLVCVSHVGDKAVWGGKAIALLLIVCELTSILLTTMWFVFREVIILDDKEKVERFVSHWPEEKLRENVTTLVENHKEKAVEHADILMNQFLSLDIIALEVARRMGAFFLLAAIHIISFTVTTFALVTWTYGGLQTPAVANLSYPYLNIKPEVAESWPRLLETSLYLNLITISTTGFGDMAPAASLCARILVDVEVISSMFLFIFGLNMLASILVENSYQSWATRRELLRAHLRLSLAQAWSAVQ
jgi:hypothetical protein